MVRKKARCKSQKSQTPRVIFSDGFVWQKRIYYPTLLVCNLSRALHSALVPSQPPPQAPLMLVPTAPRTSYLIPTPGKALLLYHGRQGRALFWGERSPMGYAGARVWSWDSH